MPLFVCDKCRAIENTACGHYWTARGTHRWFEDASLDRMALCSECCPERFRDGSPTRRGSWHGRWPKVTATSELIEQYGRGNFVYTSGL